MSASLPSADELDEQIILAAGRRNPFTMIGDWIQLADATPTAKALYGILAMHVNLNRGDQRAWPSLATLAKLLKLGKPTSVVRYSNELATLGAIDISKERYANGMRCRNIYTVHETPPEGYTGPTSLEEYYLREKGDGGSLQGTTARPAEMQKTAGQTVVPSRGGPEVPSRGVRRVLPRGLEQDEVKQDEEETTTTSCSDAKTASPREPVDADIVEINDNPPVPAPGELFGVPAAEQQEATPARKKPGRAPRKGDAVEQALHDRARELMNEYIAERRKRGIPDPMGRNPFIALINVLKEAYRAGHERDVIATALWELSQAGTPTPSIAQLQQRILRRTGAAIAPASQFRTRQQAKSDGLEEGINLMLKLAGGNQ